MPRILNFQENKNELSKTAWIAILRLRYSSGRGTSFNVARRWAWNTTASSSSTAGPDVARRWAWNTTASSSSTAGPDVAN
jgi:hypothetical protein